MLLWHTVDHKNKLKVNFLFKCIYILYGAAETINIKQLRKYITKYKWYSAKLFFYIYII